MLDHDLGTSREIGKRLARCLYLIVTVFMCTALCGRASQAQTGLGGSAAGTPSSATMVDDSDAGWMWKGMARFADPSLYGGTAHAGGSGSTAVYSFNGTGADIIGMAGQSLSIDGKLRKIGSANVSVDGNSIATVNLVRPEEMYSFNIFSVTGLPMGIHVLEVAADGGWLAIDCLRVHQDRTLPKAAPKIESATTSNISQFSNEKIWTDGVNTYISFNFWGPYVHFRTYWDIDLNPNTGYTAGVGVGAEYLVEDTTLYKSTANGPGWSWATETVPVTSTITGNKAIISIPGSPSHANVLVQALAADWKNSATDTNIVRFNNITR